MFNPEFAEAFSFEYEELLQLLEEEAARDAGDDPSEDSLSSR